MTRARGCGDWCACVGWDNEPVWCEGLPVCLVLGARAWTQYTATGKGGKLKQNTRLWQRVRRVYGPPTGLAPTERDRQKQFDRACLLTLLECL